MPPNLEVKAKSLSRKPRLIGSGLRVESGDPFTQGKNMSFYRHLFASVLLAGTVFAAATLPLATFGSKSVAIQFEGRPVLTGRLKDLAAPYLGLALTLSIGAGVTNLAVLRWYQASRQAKLSAEQLATLQQQIVEKESLIETLKFAPSRLQAAGLERFLPEEPRSARSQFGVEPLRNDHQVAFKPSA